jgi:hypothetical protein
MMGYTRRQLLASVGVGGLAATGIATTRSREPWTTYTYAVSEGGENRLRVAWYETYNGTLQEHQVGTNRTAATAALDPASGPTYVSEVTAPVIDLEGIMPGDRGKLAIGLSPADSPADTGPLALDLAVTIDTDTENARSEPEVKVGDTSSSDGELPDALQVTLWADDGFVSCDGVETPDDTPIVLGSLRDAVATLADGYRLCGPCFGTVRHRCLGLRWQLPSHVGNRVQTDAVTVSVAAEIAVFDGGNGS